MYIDWTKIKNGFQGFENLAVEFVKEHESKNGNFWSKTKSTRDKNHDAISVKEVPYKKRADVAVFVGYSDNINVWWMEAKYSAQSANEGKMITRYRLDATIVSAVLSKNVSKIIFITNLNIASKTISDIRKALMLSCDCNEVLFYTKSHLEYWISEKPYKWVKKYFSYSKEEFSQLVVPPYNCIEELSLYKKGDNFFQEPLNLIYTNFVYEMHFSIFVQKNFTAQFTKSTNIILLEDKLKTLELKSGINVYMGSIKIPSKLQYEPISKKDMKGEYKDVLPISLVYQLQDPYTHENHELHIIPNSALKIIDSSHFYIDIPSQKIICKKLIKETIDSIQDPERNCSVVSLFGSSGIGKSFTIQLYKNEIVEKFRYVSCFSYIFSGNKLDDMKTIKKIVFNLFFPFIFYEDLDEKYIQTLQQEYKYFSSEFWNFIYYQNDIESFMKYYRDMELLGSIFPAEIGINNRVIIWDDMQKLSQEFRLILSKILKIFITYRYPVFCILVSQSSINLEEYRINKQQHLIDYELSITFCDVKEIFSHYIEIEDLNGITILFGSVIEIVYFIKYINTLNNAIKNINDFKLAYNLFKKSEVLKNEIISKFKSVFQTNEHAEELCSYIYYTPSGIQGDILYSSDKSIELLKILLEAQLIKKSEDNFYICWHDYYKEIYINHFPLKSYGNLHLPFKTTYDIKIQFDLNGTDKKVIKKVLMHLEGLYSTQKFYEIYYILETIFARENGRKQYINLIDAESYFLMFTYFCYANTNAGTVFSSYEMFHMLYMESMHYSNATIQTIHYIALFEIINSLYERDKYHEAMEKIDVFNSISQKTKNNWVYLFEWDFLSIQYAVSTIKMFIDSENGITCTDKIPDVQELNKKDVAFSTYRLLLCNLTNDYSVVNSLLRKYNLIVQDCQDYDMKTKYMYNFAVKFLDCIDNKIDINEVIRANNLLKTEFFNDYNRHIFIVAILALLKCDLSLCEQYRMEYIKTNRPMKPRQRAFQEIYSALISFYKNKNQSAIKALKKAEIFFQEKPTYLAIIHHNINHIKKYKFSLKNMEFYLGGDLIPEKYYIDIRMLY